jgi:hypothetical protein
VWLYALTIFLSAFLLFQIQPMIGKWILPWFGGGPAIWTTCLLFFQVALVAGYGYAHVVRSCLRERGQMIAHLLVLAVALAFLPIHPWDTLKPPDGSYPVWRVMLVLAAAVGLPFFVLSTTSPLLQAWFSVAKPGRSPYVLYSLSNLGSLLALGSYPFVFEPLLRLKFQSWGWSVGFVLFAVLCAGSAIQAWRKKRVADASAAGGLELDTAAAPEQPYVRPGKLAWVLWMILPACGTTLLAAVTNQMCSEVGGVPFMWILTLGLYLLTFILVFFDDRIYFRPVFWALLPAAAVTILYLLYKNVNASMLYNIAGFSLSLFVCCMVCHGELAKLRPHPRHLTAYYLLSSVGGALGTVFVAILAPHAAEVLTPIYERLMSGLTEKGFLWSLLGELSPRLLTIYFELHVGILACFILAVVSFWYSKAHRDRTWWGSTPQQQYLTLIRVLLVATGLLVALLAVVAVLLYVPTYYKWHIGVWSALVLATVSIWYGIPREVRSWWPLFSPLLVFLGAVAVGLVGAALWKEMHEEQSSAVSISRNFYGVLQVLKYYDGDPEYEHYSLQHGRILHGSQYTSPELRDKPATYYGPDSGAGRAVVYRRPDGQPRKVGVVGLGTGTMAAFAKKDWTVRFYEINTAVLNLSDHGTVYGPDGNPLNAKESQSMPTQFTYLKDARARGAKVEVVLGDARLSLERELREARPQQFDVLALDAFTSDSIPIHLLTLEAVRDVYMPHLKPDGVLAVHISNRFLDLRPVVLAVAEELKLNAVVVDDLNVTGAHYLSTSVWVLLSRDQDFLLEPEISGGPRSEKTDERCLWTDDYSNLMRVIRWRDATTDDDDSGE